MVSSDLRWTKNTEYICQKAMQRMWVLQCMKVFKFDAEYLLDTYKTEIRSLLELAVPVWHSGLTVKQASDIERVQKTALHIILGEDFTNYDVACTIVEIDPRNKAGTALSQFCKERFEERQLIVYQSRNHHEHQKT